MKTVIMLMTVCLYFGFTHGAQALRDPYEYSLSSQNLAQLNKDLGDVKRTAACVTAITKKQLIAADAAAKKLKQLDAENQTVQSVSNEQSHLSSIDLERINRRLKFEKNNFEIMMTVCWHNEACLYQLGLPPYRRMEIAQPKKPYDQYDDVNALCRSYEASVRRAVCSNPDKLFSIGYSPSWRSQTLEGFYWGDTSIQRDKARWPQEVEDLLG